MITVAFAVGGAVLLLLLGNQLAERNHYKSQIGDLNSRIDELEATRQAEQERYLQEVENKNREIAQEKKNAQVKKILASIAAGAAVKLFTNDPVAIGVIMSVAHTIFGNNNQG